MCRVPPSRAGIWVLAPLWKFLVWGTVTSPSACSSTDAQMIRILAPAQGVWHWGQLQIKACLGSEPGRSPALEVLDVGNRLILLERMMST